MSSVPTESILRTSVIASGLVAAEQLDYCLRIARHRQAQQGLAPETLVADELLAEILIEQNILTEYQADQLRAGRTKLNLGPYIITDWIGQGGMGQVFKAVHQVMGRQCAVKVLPRARATEDSLKSFAREIRMQAGLDCPYLVRAFDAGHDGKVHYLVTEFVPGMDLRRLVNSRGPLPVQQAAQIIMQAALGLAYAHQAGLVHRDVKPGNILVTPEGDAKVSDVGLAGFAKDLINDPRAGKIVGTTDYLSPEQIRTPLEIQPASDIYSLGCTLYYSVCGKVPFPGGDTKSKLRRHLEEYPLHPRNFVADITEDFADIIVDMMEKEPRKRIASAAEVASRLEPWAIESYSVGAVTMARSPWLAPPPPSHDELPAQDDLPSQMVGDNDPADVPSFSSDGALNELIPSQEDGALAHSDSRPPFLAADPQAGVAGSSTLPPAFPPLPPPRSSSRMSNGLLIALTIAIVVPPTLLIGAILGYLAGQ